MGYLVEKYTSSYFLRKDDEGNCLSYGVEGIESFINGQLRDFDRKILEAIRFSGANVIEFGFGRGETIKYIWEQGANSYTGVDFSTDAFDIARGFLDKFSIVGPQIFCMDALDFVRKLAVDFIDIKKPLIDVVIMLDFVEHIPRNELKELLKTLKPILSPNAVVIVNTPEFLVDNDVIADGLNINAMDSSDLVEETKGMHCNRYTLDSLRRFFSEVGYLPISRGHYFALPFESSNAWNGESSYSKCWTEAYARGVLLKNTWVPEIFESAYESLEKADICHFNEGNLSGITLYVTPTYLEYYKHGNYDTFLINYLSKYNLSTKTVFDLGAFVGVTSMQFAHLVGSNGVVCAFEPNPFNADRFKLNLSENPDLCDRIKIFSFAISNVNGKTKFKVHRDVDSGISSASYLQDAYTTLSEQKLSQMGFSDVDVDMVTLDDFVQNSGFIPACIKIDIEGAEHLALAGAINTLKKYRPLLAIELHSVYCAVATLKIIMPLGYSIDLLHIEPDGRCFIAANSVTSNCQIEYSPLQFSNNNDEFIKLELVASKARYEASLKSISLLTDELNKLLEEKEAYKATIVFERSQNQFQNLQLEQQQALLEQKSALISSLQANLYRYQMFPLIRIVRKLRRAFF